MVDPNTKILIVGGGIGGLTAAIAFAQKGYSVSVYEQAPVFGEVGAGLTLAPNAMHALYSLGLGKAIDEYAKAPRHGGIGHYQSGKLILQNNRGDAPNTKYGAPYYQIHRADFHHILVTAAEQTNSIELHLGCALQTLTQNADNVTAVFENGQVASGDVLIGSDGVRSVTRTQLFGTNEAEYTGYLAYRAIIPMEQIDSSDLHPDSLITIGPGQSIARYPVSQGTSLNVAAFTESNEWTDEGWSIPATRDEVLSVFSTFHPKLQNILKKIPEKNLFKWGLFSHPTLDTWVKGRATLLGDAAHPMLPFLGQGAAMAIEDGYIIARSFEESESIEDALSTFELTRKDRADMVTEASLNAVLQFHSNDPDNYDRNRHRDAESLGLFDYNPCNVKLVTGAPQKTALGRS